MLEDLVIRLFLLCSGIVPMLLFSWHMDRRTCFWLRLIGFVVFYLGIDSLSSFMNSALENSTLLNDGLAMLFFRNLYKIVSFLALSGALCFLYEGNFVTMMFCSVSGKCTMHIAEYLSKVVFHFSVMNTVLSMVIYAVVYLIIYLLFARRLNSKECVYLSNAKVVLFTLVVLIATDWITLSYSSLWMIPSVNVYIFALVTMICIVSLSLLHNLFAESQRKLESVVLNQLRKKEREQYDISKETINLIGIRQHDLRNLLESHSVGLTEEQMKQMICSLDDYDLPLRTGNKTLDVILTEKHLICKNKGITLECSADGSSMGFLSEMDIYSLFLNALNNAVESADKLQDPARRVIWMKCYSRGSLLFIQVRNEYDEITPAEGGYQTTKADRNSHGFGLRSMKLIAEKYGGEMSVQAESGVFRLGFVIPIP